MKSKMYLVFALITILAMSLSACQLSQSAASPTQENVTFSTPLPTPTGMGMLEQAGTQAAKETAIAAGTPAEALAGEPAAAGATDGGIPTMPPAPGDTPMPSPTPEVVTEPQVQPTIAVQTPANYTLQEGEFPYCIARRFNINPDELLALNGLTDGGLYLPGLTLKIPTSGKTFPGSTALKAHPAQYTVLAGDTIYGIACKFGDVAPANIAAANNLAAPFTLTPGQTLQIP